MSDTGDITLFHAPNTRSSSVMCLLEELGAPYQLHIVNLAAGEQRRPEFLAVNPLGKVPALRHGTALVTEQVAICLYLADLFPAANLAPALNDPDRGPYLRWMVYYAACFEPAVVDRFMKREPGHPLMSPYGSYDAVIDTLVEQLAKGPYLLGERFSAADVLWGGALGWTTGFKLVPERPAIMAYVARARARQASRDVAARDGELAAAHAAASAAAAL